MIMTSALKNERLTESRLDKRRYKMTSPISLRSPLLLLLTCALLLLAGCSRSSEEGDDEAETPAEPARHAQKLREPLHYQAVEGTQGALREATLYSQRVPSLGSEVEVRSLLLLPRETVYAADREALVEVLTGEVWVGTGKERKAHPTGDIWLIPKGSHSALKAKGEIAVLRTISLNPKPGK
jgi:hypothetical protein